jgi:hypothetical protein
MSAGETPLFTSILHGWVDQARQHPHSLAAFLRNYQPASLATRLQCDEQTVCWLQLYGCPDQQHWEQELRRIASDLQLDWRLLDALLREVAAK